MDGTAAALGIEHVFVLMLENRSFDIMSGFSGITGTDAETGQMTRVNGLTGNETNTFEGEEYRVIQGADYRISVDPRPEFSDTLHQLCGPNATYQRGGSYPTITNVGYVASYAESGGTSTLGAVMKCYGPDQLPILNALAREFVVCDRWHSSLPGPTWPNRMFVHAASSGGLEHSPTVTEIAEWEAVQGFAFPNGTIFDRLKSGGVTRCLYAGDDFPMVAALKGISPGDIRHYSVFSSDLAQAKYPYQYVFIEPSYDVLHDYRAGSSQHPLSDVTAGEALIKETYEAIRNSPVWNSSVLIITWDDHGGFFDHAIPPAAPAPGDTGPDAKYNNSGFTFQRYGPRVPAIVISPLIPKNLVDHRIYDHSCIPGFLESLFGMAPLTARDANAARLDALILLREVRETPQKVPAPANSGARTVPPLPASSAPNVAAASVSRPEATINEGNLPAIVHSAMQQVLSASPPSERATIVSRVASLQTRADAAQYMAEVQKKVRARRAGTPSERIQTDLDSAVSVEVTAGDILARTLGKVGFS